VHFVAPEGKKAERRMEEGSVFSCRTVCLI